jgi:hypothetical protein
VTGDAGMNIAAIAAALRERPAEVAEALYGTPTVRTKREWRWGRKGSLSVVVSGPKAGSWFSHEDAIGGDMLALAQREYGREGGFDWARRFVGEGDSPLPAPRRSEKAQPVVIDLGGTGAKSLGTAVLGSLWQRYRNSCGNLLGPNPGHTRRRSVGVGSCRRGQIPSFVSECPWPDRTSGAVGTGQGS